MDSEVSNDLNFKMKFKLITDALAQIVAEILFQEMAIFCWRKKATSGSSFFFLQKKGICEKDWSGKLD